MDSELKRRLVGTVIIVSLVVIFVPMLFEEKDDLTQDSTETRIPEFPQDFDSQVIPLPEAVPEPKAAKESAPESTEEPPVPPVVRRDDALDPLDVPAGKTPAPAEDAAPPPQAGAAAEDEEDFPKPAAKPAATAKPGTVPAAPLAKPGAKSAAETATKPAKPVTEPAPKQTVAPKQTKKKTVTTTALPRSPAPPEIKAIPAAPQPPAVKPAPVPTTAAVVPGAAAAGAAPGAAKEQASLSYWMIQAGSFDDEANAKNLKTRLRQANILAFSEKITAPNGAVKYRVRVGPEKERAKAEEILKRMESEAGVKGMIVSYP